jgi:hypothetical protein
MKFLSSEPQKDLLFFKDTIMNSEKGDPNKKVTGLQFIKLLPDTLIKI